MTIIRFFILVVSMLMLSLNAQAKKDAKKGADTSKFPAAVKASPSCSAAYQDTHAFCKKRKKGEKFTGAKSAEAKKLLDEVQKAVDEINKTAGAKDKKGKKDKSDDKKLVKGLGDSEKVGDRNSTANEKLASGCQKFRAKCIQACGAKKDAKDAKVVQMCQAYEKNEKQLAAQSKASNAVAKDAAKTKSGTSKLASDNNNSGAAATNGGAANTSSGAPLQANNSGKGGFNPMMLLLPFLLKDMFADNQQPQQPVGPPPTNRRDNTTRRFNVIGDDQKKAAQKSRTIASVKENYYDRAAVSMAIIEARDEDQLALVKQKVLELIEKKELEQANYEIGQLAIGNEEEADLSRELSIALDNKLNELGLPSGELGISLVNEQYSPGRDSNVVLSK